MTARNPWGLTEKQAQVLDAMCETGLLKVAADRLSIPTGTAHERMKGIRQRVGARTTIRIAVMWTEWKEAEKRGATPSTWSEL